MDVYLPQRELDANNSELSRLLDEWYVYHSQLEDAKAFLNKEMELRKRVVASLLADPDEGVNNVSLPNGATLKIQYKLTRTVDEAPLQQTMELLREKGYAPEELFSFKPNLVLKSFRKLDPVAKGIVEMAITTKPSAPTIEVIPAKEDA